MSSGSPIKPTVTPATRESLTANLKESGLPKQLTVDDFATAFFRNALPTSDCALCVPDDAPAILAEIGRSKEKKAYKPTCKLLTGMCDKYAGIYNVAEDDQLAFVTHSDHSPCQHPHSYTAAVAAQKPDLVVTKKWMAKLFLADVKRWTNAKRSTGKKSLKPAVAWPVMGSLVEGKGPSDPNAHFQATTYLGSLLLARPDLIGCFGMAIDSKSFRLIWCDVSGVFYTKTIQWSDPQAMTLLVQYIRQLHLPLVDSTVRLAPRDRSSDTQDYDVWTDKSYAAPPVWFVDDDEPDKFVYVVEKILSVGPAWSRKNWVARASERLLHRNDPDSRLKLDSPIVIKDSFIIPERSKLSSEGDILGHIHRKGRVPGVVAMESQYRVLHDDKETPVSNVQLPPELDSNLRAPTRVRYRLFLPEYDLDHIFTACSSVKECLEVIYDVLEMSRYLHEEHGITHRDINPFNVLVTRNAPTLTVPASDKYQPVFIRQLLSYQDPKPAPNAPTCLLLDFDNAFWADRATGAPRTATPGFVARTLALRRLAAAYRFGKLPQIPTLAGMAKDAYLHFHGQERYERANVFHDGAVVAEVDNDPTLAVIPHSPAGSADEENPFNSAAVSRPSCDDADEDLAIIPHAPRHEAESSYWVLVWLLITAMPRGALIKEDNTHYLSQVIGHFESHRIDDKMVEDARNSFVNFDKRMWAAVLHKGFRALVPFLAQLSKVVKPEYGWVTSTLNPYHLHEAMQRVILEETCRLEQEGDISIDMENRRKVESRSKANDGLSATAMRVHAARSARERITAASHTTGEKRQTRSQKRSRAASSCHGPEASTSDVANDRQKKQKTAHDGPGSSTSASTTTLQRQPRGQ